MTQPTSSDVSLDAAATLARILPSDTGDDPLLGSFRDGTQGRRFGGIPGYGQPETTDVIGLLTDSSAPARVADVECGQGWAAINLALAFPTITVAGFGSVPDDIPVARENAETTGVADRVTFDLEAADIFTADDPYDVVFFFGCVHKMPEPRGMVDRARLALTERGVVVVVSPGAVEELEHPDHAGEGGDADVDVGGVGAGGVGAGGVDEQLDLDPAEQVQMFFPDARVLWCPAPGLFDPGLTSQRAGARKPEETRIWLTGRVEVAADGLAAVGTLEGQGV